MSRPISRRRLLGAALAGAGLGLIGCKSDEPKTGYLGVVERWNQRVQGLLFSKGSTGPVRSTVTADDAFPVYHASDAVPLAPADWALRIGGLVARPRTLALSDLYSMTRTDLRIEHHCVEGWSAVADWHGVRLRQLAELVGVDPRAKYVQFKSFDAGYSSSWDMESALHPETLIAYGMNGKDLGPDHGAPVRLYGSVKLGYKNVKYLTEINFLDQMTGGYWEDQGYEWYAGV